MKKLLCIVCLLATALFVNVADASIGSPVRNGSSRGTYSISTVRVSATCTTCGRVAVARPVVVRQVSHVSHRTSCTSCGRRMVHRPVHHGFGHHIARRGFGHHFVRRGFAHRTTHRGIYGKRFACTRCGI